MLLDLGFSESDKAIEQFFSLPFLRQCKIMTLGINLVHLHAVCVCALSIGITQLCFGYVFVMCINSISGHHHSVATSSANCKCRNLFAS